MDEVKKSCASGGRVRENSEFYRGALARVTFPVSEVKEACRNFVDFAKIGNHKAVSFFGGPKKVTF